MKIAIDLRALQSGHEFRGIGAYAFNILQRFPYDERHEFVFVRYNTSNPVEDFKLPVTDYKEVIVPQIARGTTKKDRVISRVKREFQPQFKGLKAHKPDVFFQLDYRLGLPRGLGARTVVTMYDLIPFVFKDLYQPSWLRLLFKPGLGKRRRVLIVMKAWLHERPFTIGARAAKRADELLSISECTTHDLQRILGVPNKRITTIPLAPSTSKLKVEKRPAFMEGVTRPFLLFIGGMDARRQVVDLIHAFNVLNGRGHSYDLVLVGKKLEDDKTLADPDTAKAVLRSSYTDSIHTPGFVTQEDKAWLLQNAFAFVYPTLYEGFGMPPLEAMVQGCPTITYRNSCLPENLGDAALLLERPGGDSIRQAIIELERNPQERARLIAAGYAQVDRFSWDRCADQTFQALTRQS